LNFRAAQLTASRTHADSLGDSARISSILAPIARPTSALLAPLVSRLKAQDCLFTAQTNVLA